MSEDSISCWRDQHASKNHINWEKSQKNLKKPWYNSVLILLLFDIDMIDIGCRTFIQLL